MFADAWGVPDERIPLTAGLKVTQIAKEGSPVRGMMLDEGVFVTGFGYPVVPKGEARVRCQLSAAHTKADIDEAIDAFKKVGKKVGII